MKKTAAEKISEEFTKAGIENEIITKPDGTQYIKIKRKENKNDKIL